MNGVDSMEGMVQDHEKRIYILEENQKETNDAVRLIQKENQENRNSILKLENSVLTANREQREIMERANKEQKDILEKANKEQKEVMDTLLKSVLDTNRQVYTNTEQEKKRQHSLRELNAKNMWQLALMVSSTGGLLYGLFYLVIHLLSQ